MPSPLPRFGTHPFPAWFWDVTQCDVTSRLVLGCVVPHAQHSILPPLFLLSFLVRLFFFFLSSSKFSADCSPSLTCTWGPILLAPLSCAAPVASPFITSPSPPSHHPHRGASSCRPSSCRPRRVTFVMLSVPLLSRPRPRRIALGCPPPRSGSLHGTTLTLDLQRKWRGVS